MNSFPDLIENKTIDQIYEESKGIIRERASSFAASSGIPIQDLEWYGLHVFRKALEFWDPAKKKNGKFTSFLYWRLSRRFVSFVNDHKKFTNVIGITDEVSDYMVMDAEHASKEFSDYMTGSLDSDAIEVLSVIKASASEFLGLDLSKLKIKIVEKMNKSLKWNRDRSMKSILNIKSFLSTGKTQKKSLHSKLSMRFKDSVRDKLTFKIIDRQTYECILSE